MGLFSGPRSRPPDRSVEERSTYYAPTVPAIIGSPAEVVVTTTTAEQSVAIRSTTDLIASLTSELPAHVYETGRGVRHEVDLPANLTDPGGDGQGLEDWVYRLLWSWLLAGNAVGTPVETDRMGRPLRVDLLHPDDVGVSIVDGRPRWRVRGRPVDDPDDILHWRVNPVPGRLLGFSPIEHHASTIGISLATSRFGRAWFHDGAHPSGLLRNTEVPLDDTQAGKAKAKVLENRGNSEPLVLGKGWEWSDIQVTPEESQFLQTAGMSEAQCCRIYGPGFAEILGYETGGKSMTYTNIVDRRQDLLVLSMNRWIRRAERVLTLLAGPGRSVQLNRDALLEATTLQRYQAHGIALKDRWRVVNEIRQIEGLSPVPWGNDPNGATGSGDTQKEAGDANAPGA